MKAIALTPSASGRIELAAGVSILGTAMRFHFSRSGGPGGQNVNKINSKVELRIQLEAIEGLSVSALARLRAVAGRRLTTQGELLLVSEVHRTQEANRVECLCRLQSLVAQAVIEPKIRRKTKPARASRERRLQFKKIHSAKKQQRKRAFNPEGITLL